MKDAVSDKNNYMSSWRIQSGHNKNMALSRSFVIVEKLAFSSISVVKKIILPVPSDNEVHTITLAIYIPSTSVVPSTNTHIL